jgi:hypothetical protein
VAPHAKKRPSKWSFLMLFSKTTFVDWVDVLSHKCNAWILNQNLIWLLLWILCWSWTHVMQNVIRCGLCLSLYCCSMHLLCFYICT